MVCSGQACSSPRLRLFASPEPGTPVLLASAQAGNRDVASFLINLFHNIIIIINNNNNIRNIDLCGVYHNVRVRRPRDWSGGSPRIELHTKGGVKRN